MPETPSTANSVLRVFLFTDIANSAELKTRHGDASVAGIIARHDALFRTCLLDYGGTEIDNAGDGFFATFELPSAALRCALAFQSGLEHLGAPVPLAVRIAVHAGEVNQVPGAEPRRSPKLVGLAIDLTARLAGLAVADQILLTREVFDSGRQHIAHGSGGLGVTWRAHGLYRFKGIEAPVEVFEVGIEGKAAFVAPPTSEKASRLVSPDDEEVLGWRPAVGLPVPSRDGWVIESKIGEGGFGEVWLARNRKSGEPHVFKFCFRADRVRALKREVVLFRLLRDNLGVRDDISHIVDWNFEAPPYFIESDYTVGGNLLSWVESTGGLGRVAMQARLDIVAQTAEALAAAHSVGILHKDIKPSNILIWSDIHGAPRVRLADFGIGHIIDPELLHQQADTLTGFTATSLMSGDSSRTGTRLYMAPELLEGKPASQLTDVYSLGVLLYQIVIGNLTRALATGWEADVPDARLRRLIARCVQGRAERRMPAASELARRLRRFRPGSRLGSRAGRVVGALSIAGLVVAGLAYGIAHWRESSADASFSPAAKRLADDARGTARPTPTPTPRSAPLSPATPSPRLVEPVSTPQASGPRRTSAENARASRRGPATGMPAAPSRNPIGSTSLIAKMKPVDAIFTPLPARASIFFVDRSARPGGGGKSWAGAVQALQTGIDLAAAAGGGQVWAAAGTYDEQRADPHGALVMKEGVHLFGGFAGLSAGGDETSTSQRDWKTHPTIIDGKQARGGQYAYHVIKGASNATLDGFTVTGGEAPLTGDERIGAGMLNTDASPLIANCRFSQNSAPAGAGAAIANRHSSPTVINCTFSENAGGAIEGSIGNPEPNFLNCVFANNTAPAAAGAVFLGGGSYRNCVFAMNRARHNGGAGLFHWEAHPLFENCIFAFNSSGTEGGALVLAKGSHTVRNCVFFGNEAGGDGATIAVNGPDVTITDSIVWGNAAGGISISADAKTTVQRCCVQGGVAGEGILDADPLFADPTQGDFRLAPGSPSFGMGLRTGAMGPFYAGAPAPTEARRPVPAASMHQQGQSNLSLPSIVWRPGPDMPEFFQESRAALLDGKLYVVGGRTGHGSQHACVPTVFVYSPDQKMWSKAADLPAGRAAPGVAALGGYLYCFGGLRENDAAWWGWPVNQAWRYNPKANVWESLPDMPTARSNFVTAVLGDMIYCAGGNVHWPNATSQVDVYDPAKRQWSTVAAMPEPRGSGAGGTYNGRLVTIAGLSNAQTNRWGILVYDPATNRWSQTATMKDKFGSETGFLFSDSNAMYFLGRREEQPAGIYVGAIHPETGDVDYLTPASSSASNYGTVAFDPVTSTGYNAGGSDGKNDLPVFGEILFPAPKAAVGSATAGSSRTGAGVQRMR